MTMPPATMMLGALAALARLSLPTALGDAVPFGRTVGWQEHSKNDLRSWPQLLRKGGRNFKIDPNFMDSISCASQQRVKQMDERGCFVLNHDTPSVFGTRLDYNTPGDVLAFIEKPRFRHYFTRADPFLIVLCFKNMQRPCANDLQDFWRARNWRSLVDDFFDAAQRVVARASLNVQFVLDGDAAGNAICECLRNRWRPWVATYIPGGGQQPGACLDDAFNSSDRSRGLDRFAILNTPSSKFSSAASRRYGKFATSSYPWQIYEPSDQAEIDSRLAEYTAAGVSHTAGLEFAINIDSSMLQVWAAGANLTGRSGWSDRMVEGHCSAPSSVIVERPANGTRENGPLRAMPVVYMDADGQSSFALFSFAGPPGSPLHLSDAGPLPTRAEAKTPPHTLSSTPWQAGHFILTSSREGHVSALHVDYSAGAPRLRGGAIRSDGSIASLSGRLALPGDAPVSSSCALPCPNGTLLGTVCVAQLALDMKGGLQLRMWALDDWRLLSTLPLKMPPGIDVDRSGAGHVCSLGVAADGAPGVAVAWAAGGQVALATAWCRAGWSLAAGPSQVGVGAKPRLSYAPLVSGACASRGVLMLVVQDGFCMHNERHTKATYPGFCDQVPQTTRGVLVASYGLVDDIEAKLRGGRPAMSGCDDRVLHGAYSRGAAPSAALFGAPELPQGFGIAAVHEGLAAGAKDQGECGLPSEKQSGGIILAGWTPGDVCGDS